MLDILITLTLMAAPQMAQVQPCKWPHCGGTQEMIAQVQPCKWPYCGASSQDLALWDTPAQVQSCVWPRCGA